MGSDGDTGAAAGPVIDPARLRAVVFDLDGVITDTASVHAAAWKALFDDYLAGRPDAPGEDHRPLTGDDYRRHLDGKPRYDGVADLLASRGIELPWGSPDDPAGHETVCGLGNRKNRAFLAELDAHGVAPFPTSVALVRALQAAEVGTAIISASRNCREVLEAAGLGELFPVRVDGVVADDLGLPGKPDPAVFLEAVRRLGVAPAQAAVVEDAVAGVAAGSAGGFALVIGVDRTGHADDLLAAGADVAVGDLGEVRVAAARSDGGGEAEAGTGGP